MKNFSKFLAVFLWMMLIVSLGWMVVFNNLSYLLAADKPRLHWEHQRSGYRIRIGQWTESLDLGPRINLGTMANGFFLKLNSATIEVMTTPKLQFRWKKHQGKQENNHGW